MFRVRIAETVTGIIQQEVSLASNPTFNVELCQKGSWGVDLVLDEVINKKSDLASYATSDKYSWIIQWDDYVIQAGPPTSCSFDSSTRKLSVQGTGIGGLLDQRVLRASGGTASDLSNSNNNLSYTAQTMRAIAASMLVNATTGSGYTLNVTYPTTPEAGTHTRNYYGYSSTSVWQRLTELSQVDQGLEFVFTPFLDGSSPRKLYWNLVTGNPKITGNSNNMWDFGGALGDISIDINSSIGPVHRAYTRGSGVDSATLYGYAENS